MGRATGLRLHFASFMLCFRIPKMVLPDGRLQLGVRLTGGCSSAYADGNVAREGKGDGNLAETLRTSPVSNPSAGASRVRNGT